MIHKTQPSIQVHRVFNSTTGKVSTPKKWMRTCQCGENFYSREEYTAHMNEAHGKKASKRMMDHTRVVSNQHKSAKLDVPEEILVRSRQPEPKKPEVANSRKRRKPEEPKVETTEVEETPTVDETPTKEPAKKKRRTRKRKSE